MGFKRFWLTLLIVLSLVDFVHSADIRTGGGHVIQDEGSAESQRPAMNFVGDGVSVANDADSTDVTISGYATPPAANYYVKGHSYPGELKEMKYSTYATVSGSGWETTITRNTGEYLLHMDDTGLTNSGTGSHAVTLVGNATRSATQSKFGGYSAYFDGTGDWLTTPDHTDFDFSGGVWTVDTWVYVPSFATKGIWSQTTDANNYIWAYMASPGIIYLDIQAGGVNKVRVVTTTVLTVNTWHHLAFVEIGDEYYIYINGVESGHITDTDRPANYTGSFYVGGLNASYSILGYIDEFRSQKGVAQYDGDFLISEVAYSAISTTCKLGSKCVDFDGYDDYIKIYGSDILPSGSSARTIEAWIFPTSTTHRSVIFSYGADTDNTLLSFELNGWQTADNGKLIIRTRNNALKTTNSVSLNMWSHVMLVFDGTNTTLGTATKIYINGIEETLIGITGMASSGTINTTAEQAFIGKDGMRCKTGFGNCIKFDGTDDYVATVDNVNLRPVTYLSLSAWVYRQQAGVGMSVISYGLNGNYRLHIQAGGELQFIMNATSMNIVSTQTIPLNEWTLVTATAVNGDCRIYINGNLVGTGTGTFGYTAGAYNLNIGGGSAGIYFNGAIDDVRVYNTRLSITDIMILYRYGYGDPCVGTETGLVACWSFNEKSGTTASAHVSTYNGTLTNFTSTTQNFDTDGWQNNGEFAGAIDDVAVWNVALTGATTPTISQRYNAGTGAELAGTESGLKLNYHFNYSTVNTTLVAQSATVSGIGSDANDCTTTSTPCLTMTGVVAKIPKYFTGDSTINLASGVIQDSVEMSGFHPSGSYTVTVMGYNNPTPNQFTDSPILSGTSSGSNTNSFPEDARTLFMVTSADKRVTMGWLKITGGTGICSGSGHNSDNWYPIETYWTGTSISVVGQWRCSTPDNTTTYEIYSIDNLSSFHGGGKPAKYNGDRDGPHEIPSIGSGYSVQIRDSSGLDLIKFKVQNSSYGVQIITSSIDLISGVAAESINGRGISSEQNTMVGTATTGGIRNNIVRNTYAGIRAEKQVSLMRVFNNYTYNQVNCGFCNFFSSINEYVYYNLWKNAYYAGYDGEFGFSLYTYAYNRSDTCGGGGGIEVSSNSTVRISGKTVITNSVIGALVANHSNLHVAGVELIISYSNRAIVTSADSYLSPNGTITYVGNTINAEHHGLVLDATTISTSPVYIPLTKQMQLYLKDTGAACELRGRLFDATDVLVTTLKAATCP